MSFSLFSWPARLSQSRTQSPVRLNTLHRSVSSFACSCITLAAQRRLPSPCGQFAPWVVTPHSAYHKACTVTLQSSQCECSRNCTKHNSPISQTRHHLSSSEAFAPTPLGQIIGQMLGMVSHHYVMNTWYHRQPLSEYCAAQLIGKHQQSTKEGQRVGRLTVLPIMLSAVLPYAKLEGQAVHDFLCRLAVDGASGVASSMWVVQHIQVRHGSYPCI